MIDKTLRFISVGILCFGLILLGFSTTLESYTNEKEFNEKYSELSGGESDSKKFYELRDQYLTPKFEIQNYGMTLLITGLVFLLIGINGYSEIKTPKNKTALVMIGLLAVLTLNLANVGDLFLEMHRDSYPHWADSLGIPLMGVPFMFLISLFWMGFNFIGATRKFETGVKIIPFSFDNLNYWYLVLFIITLIITFFFIATGFFWLIIPGFLWSYYYLSIMLGIKKVVIKSQ